MDYQEFLASHLDHSKVLTKENLEAVFSLFDLNKDDTIDINEFSVVLPTNNVS